jgi:hypothetical protein
MDAGLRLAHPTAVRFFFPVLFLVGGCADLDTGEPLQRISGGGRRVIDPCDAALQLGTGAREILPVSGGDTVTLYRGPQGGYMIYLGVRAVGIDPELSTFCYEQHLADTGELFGAGCWDLRLTTQAADGWYERPGVWAEVDPSFWDRVPELDGRAIDLEGTITDSDGCTAETGWDSVKVVLEP